LKTRVNQNEDLLDQTSERVIYLEGTVAEDRMKNILHFADHAERLDHQSNQAKLHCVLVTGREITKSQSLRLSCNTGFCIKILGLRSPDYPKEMPAMNMKATLLIKELITKVLGREEEFALSVRRGSGTPRYAR
jgi:hypothetical protein